MYKHLYTLICILTLCCNPLFAQIQIQENKEGFCSVEGNIVTDHSNITGYTGDGYADGTSGLDKGIHWSIYANEEGPVMLSWRYANGGTPIDRKAQLLIDGEVAVASVSFETTGGWSNWATTIEIPVTLTTGKHSISLVSQVSNGLANIDYMEVSGNVSAANCLPSYSLTVNTNNSAAGYVWYEPVQAFYEEGTSITLHAKVTDPDYFFQSWSGEYPSEDSVHTFVIKQNTEATALFLPQGTTMVPDVIGYATVQDDQGTPYLLTGGKGGQTVQASSLEELIAYLGSEEPLVVELATTISGAVVVPVKSHKTLIGTSENAHLVGIQLSINNGARNVIIKNLKISHVVAAAGIGDAISINGAKNVWIDHCDLFSDRDPGKDKDYYDGLLDIKNEASFITISWCRLHDHHKVNLVASNDQSPLDSIARITYHHNYFYNCGSRVPSIRFGKAHIFNNYYKNVDDAISSRMNACIRIEENYFENVKKAVFTNQSESAAGRVHILDNHFGTASVVSSPTCHLDIPYSYEEHMQDKELIPQLVGGITTGIQKAKAGGKVSAFHFPNPAAMFTTIECSLMSPSDVLIKLYDVFGKELSTIINTPLTSGKHYIDVNTAGYPTGTYMYKIFVDDEVLTQKLMIVR